MRPFPPPLSGGRLDVSYETTRRTAGRFPSSGWSIYTQGAWYEFGGTSAAAPNWAAFTAVLDDKAAATGGYDLGYANSTIYALATSSSYSSAFHDATSGSNGGYSAATGYDKVTGWAPTTARTSSPPSSKARPHHHGQPWPGHLPGLSACVNVSHATNRLSVPAGRCRAVKSSV
ncbi:hypothetical protein [Actinacidiphila soli]|uniref:hypothetical protein n=1 Tax=Actinacidiphila soli TaxID=2487275 RepID=UPI000FC9A7B0|nr:hypothetical protein [Actinacidiphila soli]